MLTVIYCEQNLLFVHPDHLCFDRTTYDNINGPPGGTIYVRHNYGGREGSGRSGQGRSKNPLRPTEKPMRPLVGRFGLVTKPKRPLWAAAVHRFGPPICRSGLIEITLLQHPSMLYPIIAISRVQHQCPLQSVIHPRTSTKYQHYSSVTVSGCHVSIQISRFWPIFKSETDLYLVHNSVANC